MAQEPSEPARFETLLEDVRHQLGVVAEGHSTLDQKIDRVALELSNKMGTGFADVLLTVRTVIKQQQEHERAHSV